MPCHLQPLWWPVHGVCKHPQDCTNAEPVMSSLSGKSNFMLLDTFTASIHRPNGLLGLCSSLSCCSPWWWTWVLAVKRNVILAEFLLLLVFLVNVPLSSIHQDHLISALFFFPRYDDIKKMHFLYKYIYIGQGRKAFVSDITSATSRYIYLQ